MGRFNNSHEVELIQHGWSEDKPEVKALLEEFNEDMFGGKWVILENVTCLYEARGWSRLMTPPNLVLAETWRFETDPEYQHISVFPKIDAGNYFLMLVSRRNDTEYGYLITKWDRSTTLTLAWFLGALAKMWREAGVVR